jgi:putative membrane protein
MAGEAMDEGDAPRRTSLANERTFLAWWRSGLTSLGVGIAVGRVVPELTGARRLPYALVGTAYALLGLGCVVYGARRRRNVDTAVRTGGFAPPDDRIVNAFVGATVLVAVATVALVVAAG